MHVVKCSRPWDVKCLTCCSRKYLATGKRDILSTVQFCCLMLLTGVFPASPLEGCKKRDVRKALQLLNLVPWVITPCSPPGPSFWFFPFVISSFLFHTWSFSWDLVWSPNEADLGHVWMSGGKRKGRWTRPSFPPVSP